MKQTFKATGLTCEHCANAVTQEVAALNGVRQVTVDVVDGGDSTVSVATDRKLTSDQIAAALQEAGDYTLVG